MTPILNRKLVLEERGGAPDGSGGYDPSWVPLGTIWASVEPRTGRGISHDEVAASLNRYRIIVRAAPSGAPSRPRPGQRLVDGSRVFAIRAVADFDRQGRFLVLQAAEEVAT